MLPKLIIHITLESHVTPKREISLSKLKRVIAESIAVKFPEYQVEIGDFRSNWNGKDIPDCLEDPGIYLYKEPKESD